jgi:5-methylcytosine-specific restriction protein A
MGRVPALHPRASSTKRGYGYKWQKARAGYLARHPLCAQCERDGRIGVATDLDHIIPHKGDMQLFWDRANWQGLCKPHHSAKTAREDGGFGNSGGKQKARIGADGWPLV